MDDQMKTEAEGLWKTDWERIFEVKSRASCTLAMSALERLPEEYEYAFMRAMSTDAARLAEVSVNEVAQNDIVDALLALPELNPATFVLTMFEAFLARVRGKAA